MPMLDVSWVIQDPMLSDRFNLTRRASSVDTKGRPVTVPTVYPNLVGVITPQEPSALDRADDSQTVPRSISVVTKFAARGATASYQPDLITWQGTDYLVNSCLPYNRYGAGFYEILAASMTATDVPQ